MSLSEKDILRQPKPPYAVSRPRKIAKGSGTPKSLMASWSVGGTRALRASRSSHERREWARCARERMTSGPCGSAGRACGCVTSTRWWRSSCMHTRRWCRRLQSCQSRGAEPTTNGCEPHAHLARLRSSAALPLTLFAQGTGTTTAAAGRIHDTQAPISFSAPLMGRKRLPCGTPERPIGLERKVLSREATSFPGSGGDRWTIPRCGRG
jgi:hypothetical protein